MALIQYGSIALLVNGYPPPIWPVEFLIKVVFQAALSYRTHKWWTLWGVTSPSI